LISAAARVACSTAAAASSRTPHEHAAGALDPRAQQFGALAVAQSIDVDLMRGARVGLIGPNGAGKTTFVNLLTGFLEPDSGTIHLEGLAVEKMMPEMRVKRGLARTHQINALLRENKAHDNVAIAVAEREGYAWRMMRFGAQWRRSMQIRNLHVYLGDSYIVQGATLTVDEGQAVAVLGRNGVGKTTLLRAIMGLTDPVRQGSLRWDGVELTQQPAWSRNAAGIAYVPQGRRIFPSLPVD
jgi:ABC-type branched-subunit amino acid transport system ATPase component